MFVVTILAIIISMFFKHRIILLGGRARSGKDTFAAGLIKFGYKRVAFADALKRELAMVEGMPLEWFYDRKDEIVGQKGMGLMIPRRLLIDYANTRRLADPLYFVKKVAGEIVADERYVITDCRFKNELAWFREKHGAECLSIWIERPDVPNIDDNAEVGPGDFECIVTNNGNPSRMIDQWLSRYKID